MHQVIFMRAVLLFLKQPKTPVKTQMSFHILNKFQTGQTKRKIVLYKMESFFTNETFYIFINILHI